MKLAIVTIAALSSAASGAALRAPCNPNQGSFLVCTDGSTGNKWGSCGPKHRRKYCPAGYAMCGDGSCASKELLCLKGGRGGLSYGKSVCTAEPTCNPNPLNALVCKDGSIGKKWNSCGPRHQRKFCPADYYQCANGFCSKNKGACKISPLMFKPCAPAFTCPKNSFQKTRAAFPQSFDDCECNPGFRKGAIQDGAVCYPITPAFTCPKNSFQKTRAAFPQSFDDCECNPGFRKGAIQDGAVCYPITPGSCFCGREYDPVCAGGKTYSNKCEADCAFAPKPYSQGKCPQKKECRCTREYDPVCAGGKTYSNKCEAACAGFMTFAKGSCTNPLGL